MGLSSGLTYLKHNSPVWLISGSRFTFRACLTAVVDDKDEVNLSRLITI